MINLLDDDIIEDKKLELPLLKRALVIEDVSFRYHSQMIVPTLNGINMKFPKGIVSSYFVFWFC